MRFLEWLFFLDFFFGDKNKKANTTGCLPLIAIVILLVVLNYVFESIGFKDGLSKIFMAYLYISMWDVINGDTMMLTKSFKIMMFISTIVGLSYVIFRYLLPAVEDGEGKYIKLKKIIHWGYAIPHVVLLIIRIFFTVIID